MLEPVKKDLTEFLQNNYDVMLYSFSEKKGVSPGTIVHIFNVRIKAKVIKQRKQNFVSKKQDVIKKRNEQVI